MCTYVCCSVTSLKLLSENQCENILRFAANTKLVTVLLPQFCCVAFCYPFLCRYSVLFQFCFVTFFNYVSLIFFYISLSYVVFLFLSFAVSLVSNKYTFFIRSFFEYLPNRVFAVHTYLYLTFFIRE